MALMDASVIRILVEANSTAVGAGLAPGLASLVAFEQKATSSVTKIKTTFDGLATSTKVMAGAAVSIGLLATALGSTIGPAIAFESAFAGVRKTVDGTPEQLAAIRQGILDMASAMPTAAAELAGIAETAGQLGVASQDVLIFTETIAKLGETTNLDFETAASGLAQFLNVTGGSIQTVDELASVIVDLGNNSATTETKILNFAQRLAGAGSLVGLQDQEILGLAAAFSSLGIEAEAGGTSVSRVLKVIDQASGDDLAQFAEVAGMTADEFARLRDTDPAAAFDAFIQGLAGVRAEGGDVVGILDSLGFTGERVQASLLAAAGGADTISAALDRSNTAMADGSALNAEYAEYLKTTAAQLDIMTGKLEVIAITVGSNFLGVLAEGAVAAGNGIEYMSELLTPLIRELVEFGGNVAAPFAELAAVLGGSAMVGALNILVVMVEGLTGLLEVLNAVPTVAQAAAVGIALFMVAANLTSITAIGGAVAALAVNLGSVGVAGTIAAGGMTALSAAASAGPFLLLGGLMIGLGAEMRGAADKAKELRAEIETPWAMEQNLGNATQMLDDLNRALDENQAAYEATGGFASRFADIALGALPGVTSEVLELNAAQEELNDLLGSDAVANAFHYQEAMTMLSNTLGISREQAEAYVVQLGLVDAAMDPTRYGEVETAVEALATAHANAADAAGSTAEEMEEVKTSLADAAAAADALADSSKTLLDALDALTGNGLEMREAMLDLDDALADIEEKMADPVGYVGTADAMRDLIGAGEDMNAVLVATAEAGEYIPGQVMAMRQSFIDLGTSLGVPIEEMEKLADEVGLLAEADSVLITVDAEADEANRIIDETRANMEDFDGTRYEALAALDAGLALEDFQALLDAGEGWAVALYEAQVEADVSQAEQELGRLKTIYDSLGNKTVTVTINGNTFSTSGGTYTPPATVSSGASSTYQANGSVLEFYKNGGMRENHVAQIAPAGAMRVWAEPETGGEAYIPLAASKRSRSRAIWRETGRRLGMANGGVLNFADGGLVEHFSDGGFSSGITTDSFQDRSGLPGINVNVMVNARALGQVDVDLSPVVGTINAVETALVSAAAEYDRLGGVAVLSTGQISTSTDLIRRAFEQIPPAIEFSVASAGDIVTAFDRAGTGVSDAVAAMGRNILREMDMTQFIDVMVNDFGFAREAFTSHIEEMGYSVDEAIVAMMGSGQDLGNLWQDVFLNSADATEVFELALMDVERAVSDVDDTMRRAESSFDLISGAVRDARDAQFDYLDAVERVKEAIADGEAFNDQTIATRRNYEQLIRAGDAMREYGLELARGADSAEQAVTGFMSLEAEFYAMALAATGSKDEAAALTQELFNIPDSVLVELQVEGEKAAAEVESAQQAIDELDAMTATPSIDGDADPFNLIAQGVEALLASLDEASATPVVDGDTDDFDAAVSMVLTDLAILDSTLAVAELAADDADLAAAIATARETLAEIDATIADPDFTADASTFDQISSAVSSDLEAINSTTAVPSFDADPNAFAGVATTIRNDLNTIGGTTATPSFNGDASVYNNVATGVKSDLTAINNTTAVPTLKVNDQASGVVSALRTSLLRVASTYSATINTTTTNTTINETINRTSGSIGNVPILTQRAAGGFDVADGHMPEFADASSPNWRVWKEPETGGESYIPHANDWRRPGAMQVLSQTASLFGATLTPMAPGGMISGSGSRGGFSGVVMAPGAININVSGSENPAQMQRIAETAVRTALDGWSRNLSRDLNRR